MNFVLKNVCFLIGICVFTALKAFSQDSCYTQIGAQHNWASQYESAYSKVAVNRATNDIYMAFSTSVSWRYYMQSVKSVCVSKFDGKKWTYLDKKGLSENVETKDVNLKLDKNGMPIVSYIDITNNNRPTARKWNGTSWSAMDTASLAKRGTSNLKMIQDPASGNPIIAYLDTVNKQSQITIKKWDGTTWITQGILALSTINLVGFTLDINPVSSNIYIAYTEGDYSSAKVTVKMLSNTIWEVVGSTQFATTNGNTGSISMATDSYGVPYVAFIDVNKQNKASVMKLNGTTWVFAGAQGFSTEAIYNLVLTVLPDKSPIVVSTRNGYPYTPTGMKLVGSNWVNLGAANFIPGNVGDLSIDYDNTGNPVIGFRDVFNRYLASAMKFSNNNWSYCGSFGFSPAGASHISYKVSPAGVPYVACSDWGLNKASVMKYDGTNWVMVGNRGFSQSYAFGNSLAFDNNGTPFVAYRDVANKDKITVMKYNGSTWVLVGNAGFSFGMGVPSLTFDASNIPTVAYYDETLKKGVVMKFANNTWNSFSNTSFTNGNSYSINLFIDKQNTHYVLFSDSLNGNKASVKKYDGSKWVYVGSPGFSPGSLYYIKSVLTLSPSGEIYLTCPYNIFPYNYSRVMKYDGTNWVNVGDDFIVAHTKNQVSLAFDKNKIPTIIYSDDLIENKISVKQLVNGKWEFVCTPGFSPNIAYEYGIQLKSDGKLMIVNSALGLESYELKNNILTSTDIDLQGIVDSKLSVFPNPVENEVHIINAPKETSQIVIYSLMGELALQLDFDDSSFNVSNLEKGMYFMKLLNNKNEVLSVIKIIKE